VTTGTATLETLPVARSAGWRRAALGFIVAVAALAVLALAFVLGLGLVYDGKAMPGVSAAGVPLAGLDRDSAKAKLREALPSLAAGRLTLTLDGETRTIGYGGLGRDYELDAMLDAAFSVGRAGTPLENALDQVRSLVRGTSVGAVASFDREAARGHLVALAATLVRAPVDASAVLPAGSVFFAATPGADGRRVDVDAALAAVDAALDGPDPADASVAFSPVVVEPAVTTAEAEAAARRASALAATDLTLFSGSDEFIVSNETLRTWIGFSTAADGAYAPTFDAAMVEATVAVVARRIEGVSVNARYRMRGHRIDGIVPSTDDRKVDAAASTARVTAALAALAPGGEAPRVELAVTTTPTAFSTADAEAWAPQLQPTPSGRWTTHFPVGEKNFWGKNIAIPTSIIDGYVVAPGEWFDFWTVVGELSTEKGYGPGGAIINGRTEPTGALAGGICSCSTTLFNAALRYGLEMGARRNHYYYITRYPLGLDATVFKSEGGSNQTMSFRNDTPNPILIHGINAYGIVTFELWSVDVGRKVSFSPPIVKNVRPALDTIEYTETLPAGATKRIEFPADGKDVWVTRTVRDVDGNIVHQETYYSHYARVDGVTLIGQDPTPPEAASP
jgi:vancomycin resistance protein YoaR